MLLMAKAPTAARAVDGDGSRSSADGGDASTGSGQYYTVKGVRKHAVTPKGVYHVYRGVNGWDPGPLGKLYRPRYFNGGIAVHGYPSVPSTPASHGCVRVTIGAMDFLWNNKLLPIGRTVVVR